MPTAPPVDRDAAWNDYARYRQALGASPLPAVIVDLDAVDRNLETLLAPVRAKNKTLRLATKSVRVPALIRYLVDRGGAVMKGLMAYAAREAAFLIGEGHDDVFLAYPTVHPHDLELIAEANRKATLSVAVDCDEHLLALDERGRTSGVRIPVVIEVDMAYRRLGGRVHLGVLRSPLHGAEEVLRFAEKIARHPHLVLHGVMGYEAQIAGLGEKNPFSPRMNRARRLLKEISRPYVAEIRQRIAEGLRAKGISIAFFNGGGTGSLAWSAEEDHLTELSAGSGFLDSHLFDYYADVHLSPAAFFALQVVRRPRKGVLTCAGGGYVASGEIGPDRAPLPWLPPGLSLISREAVGEVQTPITHTPDVGLGIGDPVFFRHAKAGELAEHFATYLFVRGDRIVERAPTYRGLGHCFLG
jgi:D-serine deaminase-like pyridoxal phosphate-dependent protein